MKTTLLFVTVLAAGCGSNGSDVDAFIDNVAQQQCAWEFRCCKDSEIKQLDGRKFATEEECVPYRKLQLQSQWFLQRLASREGRLHVDPELASQCLTQMDSMACNPKPGAPVMITDPMQMDACVRVLVGATPVGNECVYSSECVEGAHCVGDTAAVGRGVCVPYQQEDEICNESSDCDPKVKNLYCAKKDYHCHLRAKPGEHCEVDESTSSVLIECSNNGPGNVYCDSISSTCRQLPGDGEPCLDDPLPPGVTTRCNPDPKLQLVCDTSGGAGTPTCRAPGQYGDDCSQRACGKGFYCNTSTYTCANLPGFGQACTVSGYRCQEPYFCNTQKSPYLCDQPAAVGESCVSTPCDTGLYCHATERTCKTQLADGATCSGSPANECLSSLCSTGGSHGALTVCQPAAAGTAQCSGR